MCISVPHIFEHRGAKFACARRGHSIRNLTQNFDFRGTNQGGNRGVDPASQKIVKVVHCLMVGGGSGGAAAFSVWCNPGNVRTNHVVLEGWVKKKKKSVYPSMITRSLVRRACSLCTSPSIPRRKFIKKLNAVAMAEALHHLLPDIYNLVRT